MKKTIQTKILSSLLLSISGILFLFIEAYAQTQTDTIVISTYYPSPYGSYNKLTTKSDTFLATDNGSVGIGTTATTSTLVVGNSIPGIGLGGNTWISMGLSGAKNASGIIMGSDSVASRYLSLAWDDGNSRGQINTANSNQPLFLQNLGSGTVIIGSNTAAAKLQVFYDNNDWTLPVLRLNNSAGNQNLMDFAFNNTPHSRIRIAN